MDIDLQELAVPDADPFQMSAMGSRGVDGLITDEPDLARRMLEYRAEMSPVERLLLAFGAEVGALSVLE